MILRESLIIALINNVSNAIKNDNCNLDDATTDSLVNALTNTTKCIYNLNKKEVCLNILHCTAPEFDLYKSKGLIPEGRYDNKTKEYKWCENDFIKTLNYIKSELKKSSIQ